MRKLLLIVLSILVLTVAGCSGSSAQDDYACSTQVAVRDDTQLSTVAIEYWPGRSASLTGGYPSLAAWQQEMARRNHLTVNSPVKAGEQLLIPTRCDAKPSPTSAPG